MQTLRDAAAFERQCQPASRLLVAGSRQLGRGDGESRRSPCYTNIHKDNDNKGRLQEASGNTRQLLRTSYSLFAFLVLKYDISLKLSVVIALKTQLLLKLPSFIHCSFCTPTLLCITRSLLQEIGLYFFSSIMHAPSLTLIDVIPSCKTCVTGCVISAPRPQPGVAAPPSQASLCRPSRRLSSGYSVQVRDLTDGGHVSVNIRHATNTSSKTIV